MNAQELEKLLAEVTPGEWSAWCDDCMEWYIFNDANVIVARKSDARLIAIAPTLARRVIAAEKLAAALRVVCQHGRIDDSESRMNMCGAALTAWESATVA